MFTGAWIQEPGMQKCRKMENPNLAVRFLLKMGDASMTAALGILNLMGEKNKGELLCGLVNLYRREILSALNGLLQKDELGRNICIGDIYMAQDSEDRLSLTGRNIKVDYNGLMKNDTVKQKIGGFVGKAISKTMFGESDTLRKVVEDTAGPVAKFAVGMAPDMAEKKVLSVMNKEENKNRLLHMAEQALEERGLCVGLEDFVFVQETGSGIQDRADEEDAKERKLELSTELEDELLDAAAEYLKRLLENGVPESDVAFKNQNGGFIMKQGSNLS